MERAFSLTDEEFSRIWTMASALYAKGRALDEALREATRAYTLDLPELMARPGGLRVARQEGSELRLAPREGDPRSYTLIIATPGEGAGAPREPAPAAPREPAPAAPAAPRPIGPRLTLVRGEPTTK